MDDKGLYGKYMVLSLFDDEGNVITKENADVFVTNTALGILAACRSKNTWCFVLSPEKKDDYGVASRAALAAYASVIRERNPKLADDLIEKLAKCEE